MSVFRKQYRELNASEKELIDCMKSTAETLYDLITLAGEPQPRMAALAKTKLEEAVMWAVKGVTG